jgi:hypothetical protein
MPPTGGSVRASIAYRIVGPFLDYVQPVATQRLRFLGFAHPKAYRAAAKPGGGRSPGGGVLRYIVISF